MNSSTNVQNSFNIIDIEDKLVQFWQEILDISPVGKDVTFQRLGGNSLQAVNLAARIQGYFGFGINSIAILDGLTIRRIAKMIKDTEGALHIQHIPVIHKDAYDLSPAQMGIYVACHSESTTLAYNIISLHEIKGVIDKALLQTAFFILLSRHDILRTIFREKDGQVKQVVLDLEEIEFDIELCSADSTTIQRFIADETQKSFELDKGPLFRVLLLSTTPTISTIVFSIHHLISDGISLQILFEEVYTLYTSLNDKKPLGLSLLKVQYKDFSEWQNKLIASHENVLKQFWIGELTGNIDKLNFESIRRSEACNNNDELFNGRRISFNLGLERSLGLKKIAEKVGVTLYTACISASVIPLYFYSGQTDITIGTVLSGRENSDLNGQVGLYVNTLPVRILLDPYQAFESFLSKVNSKLLNVYRHQLYPLSKILSALNKKREHINPLFNVIVQMIELNSAPGETMRRGPLEIKYIESDLIRSKFDIIFNLYYITNTSEIIADIIYNNQYFDKDGIHKLKNKYLEVIDKIITDPSINTFNICLDKPSQNSFQGFLQEI